MKRTYARWDTPRGRADIQTSIKWRITQRGLCGFRARKLPLSCMLDWVADSMEVDPTSANGSKASPSLHLKPLPALPNSDQTPLCAPKASSPDDADFPRNPQVSTARRSRGASDSINNRRLGASESWIPHALQRRTPTLFIATYVFLIASLAVLFSFSNKHQGLTTSNQRLHYLWTYGPTAGESIPRLPSRNVLN